MTKDKTKPEDKPLTKRDRRTIDRYLLHNNATRAWLEVHPKSGYDAARSSASEFLTKPNVKKEVERRLLLSHMATDEALALQAAIARGDIGDLADDNGFFDFKSAKERGLTKLIKKFKQKTTTYIAKKESEEDREVHEVEVELYPADVAQERILKISGKLKDPNITINVSLTDD